MGAPVTGIRLATAGKIKHTKHVIRGVVHAAHTHHSGNHVTLEIKHGPKPKMPKKKGELSMYDDRPSTSFPVPKHVSKHYPIGTPVHIAIAPVGAPGSANNDDEDN